MRYWYNEKTNKFVFIGKIKDLIKFLNILDGIGGDTDSFYECLRKFESGKKVILDNM